MADELYNSAVCRFEDPEPYKAQTPAGRAVEAAMKVADAYRQYRDPGTSDLDNEQPVTLMVRLTLGEARALDRDWPK